MLGKQFTQVLLSGFFPCLAYLRVSEGFSLLLHHYLNEELEKRGKAFLILGWSRAIILELLLFKHCVDEFLNLLVSSLVVLFDLLYFL